MWKISYKIWPFSESTNSLRLSRLVGKVLSEKAERNLNSYHYIPNLLGAQLIKKCGSDDTAENRKAKGTASLTLGQRHKRHQARLGLPGGQTVIRPAPGARRMETQGAYFPISLKRFSMFPSLLSLSLLSFQKEIHCCHSSGMNIFNKVSKILTAMSVHIG